MSSSERVDVDDPNAVEAALAKTDFGDLVSREVIESMCANGHGAELFPSPPLPTVRMYMDEENPSCVSVMPSLEDLEGCEDLECLAILILRLDFRATCDRSRALIEKVNGVSWEGNVAQGNLLPREAPRKIYPWWYNPRRYPREVKRPGLFEAFGIKVD